MVVLEVKKLTFGYRKEPILRDIYLKVHEGEFLSIIGPNGSGKSTLLKCICGMLRPWSGTIYINGVETSKLSRQEVQKIISYLPQETTPPPSLMSVYEFILLGRLQYLSGKLRVSNDDLEAVNEVINLLNLKEYVGRFVNELSGGEKQLVYLAQALVKKPEILLLDEPLNHLDIKNQFKVLSLLKMLSKNLGLSIVMVMHDINQAARYSDKIVILNNGKILAEGYPDEVIIPEILEKVYGIRFRVIYDGKIPQVIPLGW